MRPVVFLVLLVAAAEGFEPPQQLLDVARMIHETCMQEAGVDDATVGQCRKKILPEVKAFKCYLECVFKAGGLYDESGRINLDTAIELMPADMAEVFRVVRGECRDIYSSDGCETAYLTVKCYLDAHHEISQFCQMITAD